MIGKTAKGYPCGFLLGVNISEDILATSDGAFGGLGSKLTSSRRKHRCFPKQLVEPLPAYFETHPIDDRKQ